MKPEQLSKTAAFIAIKFYGLTLSQPYRSMFDKETIRFYDRLVSELPSPLGSYHRMLQSSWLRKFFIFSEELLLPGDLMHILMRKWIIGKMVDQFLQKGYRQLLVLGAGFDHLAVKYSARGIQSVEIDTPEMIRFKEEFIKKNAYDNDHLHVCQSYISSKDGKSMPGNIPHLDPKKKTIVVAEGFFDYITPRESEYLLEGLNSHFRNSIALVSTVFSLDELPWLRAWIFKTGVWTVGEHLKLHLSLQEFSTLLEKHGFAIQDHITKSKMETELRKIEKTTLPILPGFHLVGTEKIK